MATNIGTRDFSHSVRYQGVGKKLARRYGNIIRPQLKAEATLGQVREEAQFALQVHRMSVVVPTYTGWLIELDEAMAARGLWIGPELDTVSVYEWACKLAR